jgi:uncharacterized phage protein gp47/JayE
LPEYGLTEAGWAAKPLAEIIDALEAGAVGIFGDDLVLEPDSPDTQKIALFAGAADEVWAGAGELLAALNPQSAEGPILDFLVQLNGLSRKLGTRSVVLAQLNGMPTTVVPLGSVVRNDDGDLLQLVAGGTIAASGTGPGFFEALEKGPVVVDAGSISTIVTPVVGWDSVVVNTTGEIGTLDESDADLRRRREASTELGAASIYDALYAAVRALDGVLDVKVVENKTLATDSLGVPGKSFMVVADGGAADEIAAAIWAKHPLGIASHGAESEVVVDSEGVSQTVNFQRPTDVSIYVSMTIATDPSFPADGDEQIKQALVDFAAGNLPGYESHRFGIGDDVEYSRLYSAINSVPGHTVSALTIGTAPAPVGTANIAITDAQVSRWNPDNVVISS